MKYKQNPVPYPWTEFLRNREEFFLFGYGSLVNQFSASEVISGSDILTPVLAYQIRRVLNYDPTAEVRNRPIYFDPDRGDEYFGVFNVEYTGLDSDSVNGVLRKVIKSDFDDLISREVGYSLQKVWYVPFDKQDISPKEAFVLVAPKSYQGRKLVNNDLLPNVPYYSLCRKGASSISKEFLHTWLHTSFLGDGRSVVQWEKDEGLIFED